MQAGASRSIPNARASAYARHIHTWVRYRCAAAGPDALVQVSSWVSESGGVCCIVWERITGCFLPGVLTTWAYVWVHFSLRPDSPSPSFPPSPLLSPAWATVWLVAFQCCYGASFGGFHPYVQEVAAGDAGLALGVTNSCRWGAVARAGGGNREKGTGGETSGVP